MEVLCGNNCLLIKIKNVGLNIYFWKYIWWIIQICRFHGILSHTVIHIKPYITQRNWFSMLIFPIKISHSMDICQEVIVGKILYVKKVSVWYTLWSEDLTAHYLLVNGPGRIEWRTQRPYDSLNLVYENLSQ